jgi:hypothetical protein
MSVKALFTLDDQFMRAAQNQVAVEQSSQADNSELGSFDGDAHVPQVDASAEKTLSLPDKSELAFSGLQTASAPPLKKTLAPLFWIDRSLRDGMADSLAKLNPTLMADPQVHAYALGALTAEERFRRAESMSECLMGFSLVGNCIASGSVGTDSPLVNSIYGQFGYSCLFIDQVQGGRQMALGIRTTPDAGYLFDVSLGLLEMPTPRDVGNLISCWLEDSRSPWQGAHYQLWRVTL